MSAERDLHLQRVAEQQKSLAALRQALLYQRDRAENAIKLFGAELRAAGDEAGRERLLELS